MKNSLRQEIPPENAPTGLFVVGPPPASAASKFVQDLRGRARAELDAGGLSQAAAAREIGISDSALSQWLSGKYGGDLDAVADRVQAWLTARAQRAVLSASLPDSPGWIETPTAVRIDAALSYAQLTGDIALIYGGAGLGKTMTARQYAAKRPNCWVAVMSPATQALSPCLERVLQTCGVRDLTGRAGVQLEDALTARVNGARGLLIIDEAQHLSLRALEALRGIHDATGAGLALLGNERVYTKITGGHRAEFAQLFSRVGKRVRLSRVDKGDVDALLASWGGKLAGGRELRAAAMAIAQAPGGLRGLAKSLRLAALFAEGAPVEARHITAALAELGMANE